MDITEIEHVVKDHPFFEGMQKESVNELVGCASDIHFNAGEMVFRHAEPANHFYIITAGRVAVEIESSDRGVITIQTIHPGSVLGWSWLFPPYVWHYDARASEVTDAITFDARCLVGKCENNPALGYDLMKRFSAVLVERLKATQLQLMDMYGAKKKYIA
jgi:CRP/FNR family cyclic AMP-dependent transcriptional regulator